MRYSLLYSLALALLALGAHSQTQTAPATQTPRALLERGALAEEQQRDFAGAQKLYEQAEAAAKAAGDTKTAAEASAAKERVLARQGATTPGLARPDEALQEQLRQRALGLLSRLRTMNHPSAARSSAGGLIDLGPAIADVLEQALHGTGGLTSDKASPYVAAAALAGMDNADADRRLVRAYDSPDPIVRKAVVGAATAPRFLELNLRAANDAVASIRTEATSMLLRSTDARAAPFVVNFARQGSGEAMVWLAKHEPERLVALAEDTNLKLEWRENALVHLKSASNAQLTPLQVRLARLVRLNAATSKELAEAARSACEWAEAPEGAQRDALLADLEREWLAVDVVEFDIAAISILRHNGSKRTDDAYRAAFERRRSSGSTKGLGDLAYFGERLIERRVDTAQFERWAALALAAPTSWPAVTMSSSSRTARFEEFVLERLAFASDAAQVSAWTALWPRVPDTHRVAYTSAFLQLLRRLLDSDAEFALPSDAAPLLRFALEQSIQIGGRNPLGEVMSRFERYDLLRILAASPRKTLDSEIARNVVELGKRNPQAVVQALRGGLAALAAQPSLSNDNEYAFSWLFAVTPQASAVALWREIWKDAAPGARSALLEVLVKNEFPAERDTLLVELYPQIEALAPDLRNSALQRFGWGLVESALPILEREIRSPDGAVRAAAMEVANKFRLHREAVAEFEAWRKAVTVEEATIADLAKLLENKNRDVVLGAVKALAILRARPALPALVKLLEREDKELQAAVKAAIDTIGG
jgi:HEAT repeat protein